MDIFGFLTMIGGLAMFLYGMNTMGESLEKLSGGKLEQLLEKLTSKRIMAVLLGMLVTGVIQSSSATTVMVVGFVNSGIMRLSQAVGIIMGANVGTTVTSWMLSLTGIEGNNVWLQMLKPSSFAPILAVLGILLFMGAKSSKQKNLGAILLGFTVLMFGMETMSGAVKPLADNEAFTSILTKFSNPVLGVIVGLLLTAVIQSSSASIGILQALCVTGAVSFGTAIPIIMGQNIGTCVTALISSVGTSKNAKRASMIHLYFNMIGTAIFLVVFYAINTLVGGFSFLENSANAGDIAVVHSLFNIGSVILLYPFADQLVSLAKLTIRDKQENKETARTEFDRLDDRFLEHPDYALELCKEAAIHMAREAQLAFSLAIENRHDYEKAKVERIIQLENEVDHYEDVLNSYLIKLNGTALSDEGRKKLSVLEYCIGNFERISDHAVNVSDVTTEIEEKDLSFSKNAVQEIVVYEQAVSDIIKLTMQAFEQNDLELARDIEPLEQVIDELNRKVKRHHLKRLRKGKCAIEMGVYIEDLLTNFERVADHCSNIGVCLLRIQEDALNAHEYLDDIKDGQVEWFDERFKQFQEEYALPDKKRKG